MGDLLSTQNFQLSRLHMHNIYIYVKLFKTMDRLCLESESTDSYPCITG